MRIGPETTALVSPLDDQLVSLSIAARLVLSHAHGGYHIDPDESLAPALQSMARSMAAVVPLVPANDGDTMEVEGADLAQWAIRLGDLRTALQHCRRQAS